MKRPSKPLDIEGWWGKVVNGIETARLLSKEKEKAAGARGPQLSSGGLPARSQPAECACSGLDLVRAAGRRLSMMITADDVPGEGVIVTNAEPLVCYERGALLVIS